jgi:energy-coupling factor transporter ATP-binding protein EcfA2
MAQNTKNTPPKYGYRLGELTVARLKGITEAKVQFRPHRVTAIVGINGSGKSTILHALACCFKPKDMTSKPYNRFSDFFTPHTHSDWTDSAFTLSYTYKLKDTEVNPEPTSYGKNKRWTPIYERRPERESVYIGLQELATLSDNKGAGRFARYVVTSSIHPAKAEILRDLSYIIGREYRDIKVCKTKNRELKGLEYGNNVYSEHTIGAGEKRVLSILIELHNPALSSDGLLLIDELDVLLHEAAFNRLVEKVIKIADKKKIEVVFTMRISVNPISDSGVIRSPANRSFS